METRHDMASGRRQLAPIFVGTAALGGNELTSEGLLGPLDAAPDMPVAPAHFRGRVLDRAGSVHRFENGDEPRTEPKSVLGLHPDLDPGTKDGAVWLGFRSGTSG